MAVFLLGRLDVHPHFYTVDQLMRRRVGDRLQGIIREQPVSLSLSICDGFISVGRTCFGLHLLN